jgi:hypothetical protein
MSELSESLRAAAAPSRTVSSDIAAQSAYNSAHGLGVTLALESLAASRPDLRAIRLADQAMTRTLAAIARRHHATPAARAFIALLPEFRTAVRDRDSG